MLEEKSYFIVFARWPDEIRLFNIEWEMIQTAAEALAAVRQNERAVRVIRHDPDSPGRDVSQDIARVWLAELRKTGFDPDEDALPGFIAEQLRRSEL